MNLSILNCYFPTKVTLRTKIIEILKKSIKNQNNIILGDFNFVESKLDTKNQYLFRNTREKTLFGILRKRKRYNRHFQKKI